MKSSLNRITFIQTDKKKQRKKEGSKEERKDCNFEVVINHEWKTLVPLACTRRVRSLVRLGKLSLRPGHNGRKSLEPIPQKLMPLVLSARIDEPETKRRFKTMMNALKRRRMSKIASYSPTERQKLVADAVLKQTKGATELCFRVLWE